MGAAASVPDEQVTVVVDAEHARWWRAVATSVGVLVACVGALVALGLYAVTAFLGQIDAATAPKPPAETEFFGEWCSAQGDVLTLRAARFTAVHMSMTFAGQIAHYRSPVEPRRSYRWDEPPATGATGSWSLAVQGADVLAGQQVAIDVDVEQLDGKAVQSDTLSFDAYEHDGGWAFALPLRSAEDLLFTRCGTAG